MSVLLSVLVVAVLAGGAAAVILLRRRRAGSALYRARLAEAASDGVLTDEELADLASLRKRHDITHTQARSAALAIYRRALRNALADHELTAEEDATLQRLQAQLGLRAGDLSTDLTLLSRMRLLGRVVAGDLPTVDAVGVQLVPDEQCHWLVRATLAERLPVPAVARVPLNAVELVVDDHAPFATHGARDELSLRDDILPHDLGVLAITSRRTIFHGAKRTVSVPHARLERIGLYTDAVRLEEAATPGLADAATQHRFLLVDDPELTAAFTLQAARLRRRDLNAANRTA